MKVWFELNCVKKLKFNLQIFDAVSSYLVTKTLELHCVLETQWGNNLDDKKHIYRYTLTVESQDEDANRFSSRHMCDTETIENKVFSGLLCLFVPIFIWGVGKLIEPTKSRNKDKQTEDDDRFSLALETHLLLIQNGTRWLLLKRRTTGQAK